MNRYADRKAVALSRQEAFAEQQRRMAVNGGTARLADDMRRNPTLTGRCEVCWINCYGEPPQPRAMPCNVRGCPHEDAARQTPLRVTDLPRLLIGIAKDTEGDR